MIFRYIYSASCECYSFELGNKVNKHGRLKTPINNARNSKLLSCLVVKYAYI